MTFEPGRPRLAVVAPGLAYEAVVGALRDLGLGPADWDALGLRLVRLGLLWPLDAAELRAQLAGAERVLVVEDKARLCRGPGQRGPLRPARPAGRPRQGRRPRPAAPPVARGGDERVGRRHPRHGARRRPARRGASPARPDEPPGTTHADVGVAAGPHAVLLLRLPAQPVDPGRRRPARRARHRLPRHGRPRRRRPRPAGRHDPDGRRGGAVDRPGPVHRRRPLLPEPRRRHVLPLRVACHPGRRRRRRRHHVQAALQPGRRHDRRPAPRRPVRRTDADPLAGHRGRPPGRRDDARPVHLRRRRARPHRRRPAPRRAGRRAVRARPGARRHRARPRRPLRGRGTPAAQTGQAADAAGDGLDQPARLRRLWRLRDEIDLPVRRPRRDRPRPQDRDPPGLVQQGLLLPRRRLPVLRRRHAAARTPPAPTPRPGRREAGDRWAGGHRRDRRGPSRPPAGTSGGPPGTDSSGARRGDPRPDGRDRWHRRRHRLAHRPDGRPPRRPLRRRRRADRARPEGRSGRRRRPHRRPPGRGHRPGRTPVRRPAARLRPPRRGQPAQPGRRRPRPDRRRRQHRGRPDRGDGPRRHRRLPTTVGRDRAHRRRDAGRGQLLRQRRVDRRAGRRRPSHDQHGPRRRGVPARLPAHHRRFPRGRHHAERRRGRRERRRLPLGSGGRRRSGRRHPGSVDHRLRRYRRPLGRRRHRRRPRRGRA